MKEKGQIAQENITQGTRQPSFFKIDPVNWPDLPPPAIKPRKQRNPYRPVLALRFTDQVKEAAVFPSTPPGWEIPQSVPMGQSPENHRKLKFEIDETEQMKAERMKREVARSKATSLIKSFKTGQISHDDVHAFYKGNAVDLIHHKVYEAYCQYAKKQNLTKMSWEEYAKTVVLELLARDLGPIV